MGARRLKSKQAVTLQFPALDQSALFCGPVEVLRLCDTKNKVQVLVTFSQDTTVNRSQVV